MYTNVFGAVIPAENSRYAVSRRSSRLLPTCRQLNQLLGYTMYTAAAAEHVCKNVAVV